jgi:DNA-binding XRE family transcriptional regulator
MGGMDDRFVRLGQALTTRRREEGLTLSAAASAAGVGRAVVQNIERGTSATMLTASTLRYAAVLGWSRRTVEDVLAGRPTHGEPPVPAGRTGGDVVVDARSVPLSPRARVVVLVTADPAATPAEAEAALAAWEDRERAVMAALGGTAPAEG